MDAHPHAAIALLNQRVSPLLCLPPEIRNQVYSYTLGGLEFDAGDLRHRRNHPDFESKLFPGLVIREDNGISTGPIVVRKHVFALTQVCRQLHAETSSLPCSLNVFSGTIFEMHCKMINEFRTLELFNQIRSIRLTLNDAEVVPLSYGNGCRIGYDLRSFLWALRLHLAGLQQVHLEYTWEVGTYSARDAVPKIGTEVKQILELGCVKDCEIKITVRGEPKLDWVGTALQNKTKSWDMEAGGWR